MIDVPPLETSRAVAAGVLERFDAAAIVATRKVVRGRQGGNVVVLGAVGRSLPLAELGRRALRGGVPELTVGGQELVQWLGGAKPWKDPVPCDASPGTDTPPS